MHALLVPQNSGVVLLTTRTCALGNKPSRPVSTHCQHTLGTTLTLDIVAYALCSAPSPGVEHDQPCLPWPGGTPNTCDNKKISGTFTECKAHSTAAHNMNCTYLEQHPLGCLYALQQCLEVLECCLCWHLSTLLQHTPWHRPGC